MKKNLLLILIFLFISVVVPGQVFCQGKRNKEKGELKILSVSDSPDPFSAVVSEKIEIKGEFSIPLDHGMIAGKSYGKRQDGRKIILKMNIQIYAADKSTKVYEFSSEKELQPIEKHPKGNINSISETIS